VAAAALAAGPTLSANPAAVVFEYTYGRPAPQPVVVTITASDGSTPALSALITPNPGTPATLFAVAGMGATTLQVGVDQNTLLSLQNQLGTYTANMAVSAAGFPSLTVQVTLSTAGGLAVIASPASLTFTRPAGATSQTVSLAGTGGTAIAFTVSASVQTGSWLSVTTSSNVTPATLTVTADPGLLASGSYSGQVIVSSPTGGTLNIPVTLVVGGSSLTATPVSLGFTYTLNGTTPPVQTLQVSSTLSNNTFTAQPSSSGNWLLVNGSTSVIAGSLPVSLNVSVNPANLAAGIYSGSINITSADGSVLNVAVSLDINGISPTANPTVLVFVSQTGGAAPASQSVVVTGVVNTNYTASSNMPWLSVSPPSGGTPAQLTVAVTPGTLAAGTYSGSVQVKVGGRTENVQVTLTVSDNPVLTTNPGEFVFSYVGGSPQPAPSTLTVSTSSGPSQTFSYATGLPPWLQVSTLNVNLHTPLNLTVTISPQSLPTGTYLADIILTPSGAGGIPVTVPVLLTVSNAPPIVPSVTSLTFSAASGAGPQSQTVQLTSSTPTTFAAAVSANTPWLSVSPAFGTTTYVNTPLTVTADATSLAEGTYTGTVILTTAGGVVSQVAVTFNVSAGNIPLTVSPSTLAFTYTVGGAQPVPQSLQVTTTPGQSFSAAATTASGASWLAVTPATGTGPGTLTATANPAGLAPGNYSGTITVTPSTGTAQTVAVSLTVTPSTQGLTATPASLTFSYIGGNPNPAPQTVAISTAGPAVSFMTASNPSWLTVTPANASTPANLTVSVDPSELGAGSYTGTISIINGSSATPLLTISASLTVTRPLPTINTIVNAASFLGGGISPGEIISIFGTALGPTSGVGATINNGLIGSSLANVQVTFNGHAAPLLYVSATQVNTIVPYEMYGAPNANVQVIFSTATSNIVSLPVVLSAPGIFSADGSGTGGGAILDGHYHLVNASNPVAAGAAIQIFATGEGQTIPAGVDGKIAALTPPWPAPKLAAASLLIGNVPAQILYIGAAPGLVAGALQINAIVPGGVPSGPAPLLFSIGGNSSQPGLTVAVQ
jgi:uncharacterized protein (TIGR03437 family)